MSCVCMHSETRVHACNLLHAFLLQIEFIKRWISRRDIYYLVYIYIFLMAFVNVFNNMVRDHVNSSIATSHLFIIYTLYI